MQMQLQGPGQQWMFIIQVRRLWGVETTKSVPKKNIRAKEEGVDVNRGWGEGRGQSRADGKGAAFTVLRFAVAHGLASAFLHWQSQDFWHGKSKMVL